MSFQVDPQVGGALFILNKSLLLGVLLIKKTKLLFISLLVLMTPIAVKAAMQRTVFSADVVASACHISVNADGAGNNRLIFNTFRKSTATTVPPREFTIRLFESGATVQGCSAFAAGQVATVQFGNPGQLDAAGVVTRGAGDGIRIDVRATDEQADYSGRLTTAKSSVNYPIDFATKGQFRFRAQPLIPTDVSAGEYNGALSFVVTYQ